MISSLLLNIYPNLKNDSCVENLPPIKGTKKRNLFFASTDFLEENAYPSFKNP